MSLHLESRWQDDDGKWTGFRRMDCRDGHFLITDDGSLFPISEAIALARANAHQQLERRPFALRLGFSRER